MSPDAQWAKLLPKDAYGKPPVIQKAPPDTIKGRPYMGRLPHYASARHMTMRCIYRCGGPVVRWKVKPADPIDYGSVSAAQIFEVVSDVFDISWLEIRSPRKNKKLTIPRFAYYALLSEFTSFSLPRIGLIVGDRDHTTILHGIRQAALRYASDDEFMAKMNECRRRLRLIMVGR